MIVISPFFRFLSMSTGQYSDALKALHAMYDVGAVIAGTSAGTTCQTANYMMRCKLSESFSQYAFSMPYTHSFCTRPSLLTTKCKFTLLIYIPFWVFLRGILNVLIPIKVQSIINMTIEFHVFGVINATTMLLCKRQGGGGGGSK